jgi:hypothetical protein
MQIHYCYQCNSRVESDTAVTVDEKVYCKKCADALSADDYFVRTDGLPLGRATPSRGIQRLTPTKTGRKTPTKAPMRSPPRGTSSANSGKTPVRGSKYGMKPASPAKGTAIRPGTPAKGSPIRRTPTKSIRPGSDAKEVVNESTAQNPPGQSGPDSRKVRAASSSAMVWGLAIVALLLIAAACVLMFFGSHVSESNTRPENTTTSTQPAEKK